jgi:hypothetical protein
MSSAPLVAFIVLGLGLSCGEAADGAADPTVPFVGTWTFGSGVASPTCPSGAPQSLAPARFNGEGLSVTKGGGSSVSAVVGTAGCHVIFDVRGALATARPGQTCALQLGTSPGQTSAVAIAVTSWTLSLTSQGLVSALSGTAASCVINADGTLFRSGAR